MSRLVFLVGLPETNAIQNSLEEENKRYHDIVQGNFNDTYVNLSYKNIMGKIWASTFCKQAEFVVKTDDDMFVDIFEVFSLTRTYLNNTQYRDDKFLLCPVWKTLPIIRDPKNKWFVSEEDIPAGEEFYPPSCSGWLYITTPATAGSLAAAAAGSPVFWIDDVWVTGYLASKVGIKHLDINHLWTMRGEELLLYKTIQTPYTHNKDFLAGPMNRNFQLSYALQRKAKWCFQSNCYNNIYRMLPLPSIKL